MKAIIASIVALLAMLANAGPFGYEMGQKIEGEPDDYTDTDGISFRHIEQNLPAPFTSLELGYTPNVGLCRIIAYVDTDDYEAQFSKLRGRITDKYGEPTSDVDGTLGWSINVDNLYLILLHKPANPALTAVTYIFTNRGVCEAETKAIRQRKRSAGPFGYEMGQKIEGEPHRIQQDGWHRRIINSNLPAPFTQLSLGYTPSVGICQVTAAVQTDDYEAQFYELKALLTDKYGEPKETIFEWGKIARWPKLLSEWPLNINNIASISLTLSESLLDDSQMTFLAYYFTNNSDCVAEAKARAKAMRQENPLLDSL